MLYIIIIIYILSQCSLSHNQAIKHVTESREYIASSMPCHSMTRLYDLTADMLHDLNPVPLSGPSPPLLMIN